jgi:fatty acid desaturase
MDELKQIEKEELKQLQSIDANLEELKDRTPGPKRAFLNGILQGMGAVAGGVAAVALIGWLLYIFGLIPGLDILAEYIEDLMSRNDGRY